MVHRFQDLTNSKIRHQERANRQFHKCQGAPPLLQYQQVHVAPGEYEGTTPLFGTSSGQPLFLQET